LTNASSWTKNSCLWLSYWPRAPTALAPLNIWTLASISSEACQRAWFLSFHCSYIIHLLKQIIWLTTFCTWKLVDRPGSLFSLILHRHHRNWLLLVQCTRSALATLQLPAIFRAPDWSSIGFDSGPGWSYNLRTEENQRSGFSPSFLFKFIAAKVTLFFSSAVLLFCARAFLAACRRSSFKV
jgi:hypothetical protein